MTLVKERELEIIKEGLTYVSEDAHITLGCNMSILEATFLRTERQPTRELEWQVANATHVHETHR